MINKDYTAAGGENATGVGVVLYSSNLKTVKETYLYSVANLVGEVGGSMGLFLGASLVSLYEIVTGLARKTISSWFRK